MLLRTAITAAASLLGWRICRHDITAQAMRFFAPSGFWSQKEMSASEAGYSTPSVHPCTAAGRQTPRKRGRTDYLNLLLNVFCTLDFILRF